LYLVLSFCFLSVTLGQENINNLAFGPQKESVGKTLDDIVAVAGKDIITRRELSSIPKKDRKFFLKNLIIKKLLLQEAEKYNIHISDTTVKAAVENQRKKSISRENLREKLIISQLQQKVVNSQVKISNLEVADMVDKQLKKLDSTVKLVDVLIRVPQSADAQTLHQTQEKAKDIAYQLKTQSVQAVVAKYSDVAFNDLGWVRLAQIPPLFAKVLVDAPINQFTKPVVDQDGIHLLKITERKQKTNPLATIPQSRVSHIFISGKNAQAIINAIYQQLKKGADFAQLAKQYSQDLGSAEKDGDLGWVSSGQMVPEFESVMNKTKVGQISQPFQSSLGHHILKVIARRQQSVKNHKILEQQARKMIFQRRATEIWDLWLSQLRDESYVEIRDD
ncbi:MAG: peptidylprolyl isomerase, partial [Ostreibacterium sp.]